MLRRVSALAVALYLTALPPANGAEPAKPKLVILVVFDQMRGDYLERWKSLYGPDGFERMKREGAYYTNCHYPYSNTVTGAGHSSMLTGTCPDRHGIIDNTWYDREGRARVNCATSNRYDRVPPETARFPVEKSTKPDSEEREDSKARGNPDRLLSPTVGDVLKEATGGKAKLVGLSFKDRGAVLPLGRKADAAYWLDSTDGMMVTSTYYRTQSQPWIAEINANRAADRWFDATWNPMLSKVDYVPLSGPDDVVGEGVGVKQGRTFPHSMRGGKTALSKSYYDALFNSPFGNDFLLEVAKAAIVGEKLGQHDVPDILTVSFSSNDAIGHCWGPDSQEVMDVTLRSDRIMADFLKFLDEKVGAGNYLLALTADHGICPLPEVSAAKGIDARRIASREFLANLEAHLNWKFDAPGKAKWIEAGGLPWIYLNRKLIADLKLPPEKVERAVADYLKERPGVLKAYTRTELVKGDFPGDDIGPMLKRSFHPARSGDVGFVLKPYYLLTNTLTGTTHGSPHPYDTHVPLLVFGAGVKAGTHGERAYPQQIASIFAKALGITPPKDAEFGLPAGIFE